jgi:hypothetical protein
MWPYKEYTLFENILVLLIPYLFILIAYFLLRPLLEKKIGERAAKLASNVKEED